MVANLLQSHQHIHHASRFVGLVLPVLVPDHFVVEILLATTHRAPDDKLGLFGKLCLHILLESSQKERTQNCVQFLEDLLADREVLFKGLLKWDVEPLIEVIKRVEDFGHKKMQKRP